MITCRVAESIVLTAFVEILNFFWTSQNILHKLRMERSQA